MFRGSSSKRPFSPLGEAVTTLPSKESLSWLDTSTFPPFPSFIPPLASIVPENEVDWFDQSTTVPPLPLTSPLAVSLLPDVMRVRSELARVTSLPCHPPPVKILPPPLTPSVMTFVPARIVSGAVIRISPPWNSLPHALNAPER